MRRMVMTFTLLFSVCLSAQELTPHVFEETIKRYEVNIKKTKDRLSQLKLLEELETKTKSWQEESLKQLKALEKDLEDTKKPSEVTKKEKELEKLEEWDMRLGTYYYLVQRLLDKYSPKRNFQSIDWQLINCKDISEELEIITLSGKPEGTPLTKEADSLIKMHKEICY